MSTTVHRPADPPTGSSRSHGAHSSRLPRLLAGSRADAVWSRPLLALLLLGTAALSLWGLSDSGYGNDFYAAAAQAGGQSWKALLFGSLDAGNAITVDKPPASLWLMGLSVKTFGFSSWSVLAPQALEGIAAVWLLYAAVRRVAGSAAGLAAGALFALAPVAVLMFRFDNPDALLVLLLVGSAYAMTRAIEKGSTWWLVLAGTLIGFGFLTKMLQAFLVLPSFALVFLAVAPTPLGRRALSVLAGGLAVIASAGWFVALVELWPSGSRPYIGGSTDDSLLQLAFGYNGLSRLSGDGAGGGGANFSGTPGVLRLFNAQMGGEISWLLPAALVLAVGSLWVLRRRPRTDVTRAAVLLWTGWLVVSAAVFSEMNGIVHAYYTVALAPAIAALVAIGVVELWRARADHVARAAIAIAVTVTAFWAWRLLERDAGWNGWLRYAVVIAAVAAVVLLLDPLSGRRGRAFAATTLAATAVALAAGPGAWALATASTAHTGSTPVSGPSGAARGGFGGGGFGGRFQGRRDGPGFVLPTGQNGPNGQNGAIPGGGQFPALPGGGQGSSVPGGTAPGGTTSSGGAAAGGGAATSSALATLLRQDAGTHRWAAATIGAQSAASLEIASGRSVMAIGGWSGSDPAPTLAEFTADVAAGRIHYFVSGGGGVGGGGFGRQGGGSGDSSAITSWVTSRFTATTVGGSTVYDLTKAATSTTSGTTSGT